MLGSGLLPGQGQLSYLGGILYVRRLVPVPGSRKEHRGASLVRPFRRIYSPHAPHQKKSSGGVTIMLVLKIFLNLKMP